MRSSLVILDAYSKILFVIYPDIKSIYLSYITVPDSKGLNIIQVMSIEM